MRKCLRVKFKDAQMIIEKKISREVNEKERRQYLVLSQWKSNRQVI